MTFATPSGQDGAPGPDALASPGVALPPETLIALGAGGPGGRAGPAPASRLPGGFAIAKRGAGRTVADSRIYVAGDDARHVDRGATARTGKLHVRTFHEERDRMTVLAADFRPSMLWGMRRAFRSVAAAEALARVGWRAVDAGGRVGLLAVSAGAPVLVRARARRAGMLAVIGGMVSAHAAALAAAGAAGADPAALADPPLDMALAGLTRLAPPGAEIVVATSLDRRGAGFDDMIGALARRRAVRLLVIEDAALANLPAGRYPVAAPEDGAGGGAGGFSARGVFRGATGPARPDLSGLDAAAIAFIDAGDPEGAAHPLAPAAPDGLSGGPMT